VSTPAAADDPLVVAAARDIEGPSPVTAALASAVLPYPGLRPFERREADIFFGRETQVDAMIDRLGRHRLLVVTGSSGCGKSSLVRAGLLEALETGLFAKAGPGWSFATLRPGAYPMTELAAALLNALGDASTPDHVALRRAGLERGPLSLIEELRERPLPDGCNLLILVDQFEELFRYRNLAGREEAEAFVALLLASAAQVRAPIYVVLTMRSDFLGRCAEFDGLAEAVSDAQYLCPRLSRDQIRSAIEGPAEVFGGKVEPRLAARIVNDMGTDPDQLPLMQHALMRLWELAQARNPSSPELRLEGYEAEGGIKGSLSRHADEILAEITRDLPDSAETARRLFCLFVEGEGENAVRRLATVAQAIEVTGKPLGEIAAVADPFRAPGRSLLMPPLERTLDRDTVLDISHESLIRQWQTLKEWVRAETASAEQYREIERRAHRWAERSAGFLDGIDLDLGLAWREHVLPTFGWAARYGGDFALAMRFLDESRARRDAADAERREQERRVIAAEEAVERQRIEAEAEQRRGALIAAEERASAADRLARRTRVGLLVLSVLLIIAAGLAWWGFDSAREARHQRAEADRQAVIAKEAAEEAKQQKAVAEDAANEAERQKTAAENTANIAENRLAEAQLNQSRFLTEKAQEALRDGQLELGELVALSALPLHTDPPDRPLWLPAASALAEARARDQQRAVLEGHTGSVHSAGFSPDGTRVVTASNDNTARLWDAKTGAALAVLKGHTDSVNSAGFSPDGARVVTASNDKTARLWGVWPLLTTDTVAYAQIVALRVLSKDEQASLFLTEADPAPDQERVTKSADDPNAMCDRLAGDPLDPHKGAPGVQFDEIDGEKAVPACRASVEAAPGEPHFSYQLGRALLRADKRDEAVALIRVAAEKSYPSAQRTLGDLYENATGVAKDDAQALLLYRQAAEGGYAPAFSKEGRLYWEGIGTEADHAEAVAWFKRGADHGDPFSHQRLAELYEIGGDQLPQNLEKALFHHAIETNLFEAAGYTTGAAIARARRGSLARALPPETAVRVAREAAAWQPNGLKTPAKGGSAPGPRSD
jgi:hypothetical protein